MTIRDRDHYCEFFRPTDYWSFEGPCASEALSRLGCTVILDALQGLTRHVGFFTYGLYKV